MSSATGQQANSAANAATATKTRSKFAKRFNMTGSGMTQADAQNVAASSESKTITKDGQRSTIGTSSTSTASTAALSPPNTKPEHVTGSSIQEIKGDTNQWIKRPRGLGVLGQQIIDSGEKVEDPVAMHAKLGEREFTILQDYMNMWTRSIGELL